MTNVAINGFGRIGRLVLRIIINSHPELNVVAINDLTDAKTLAHLFKYDSVHKVYPGQISSEENYLLVNGKRSEFLPKKILKCFLERFGSGICN